MMKKLLLTLGLSLVALSTMSIASATSSFNGWTANYVNSTLTVSTLGSIGCDVTTYTQVYSGYVGLILDYFTNTSAGDDYIWRYKSYVYGNYFLYNSSTNHTNGNAGVVIFNRDRLNAVGWKVLAGHTVRHLTTADEVSNSTFAFGWWFVSPFTSSTSNDFGNFTFHTPNYRSNGTHPTTPSVGSAYDAEVRIATFFDGDNNETTTSENRGELECERLQVRWCGDGILDTVHGEVCDHGLSNGLAGDTCSASCQTVIVAPMKPDLTIVKTVTGSTVQSGTDVYKISFNNIGSGDATGVVVTDILGTGMDYISASITPASVVNNSNGTTTITFNIGTVTAHSAGVITMTTKIKATAVSCMTVQNLVSISTVTTELSLTNNSSAAYFQVDCAPVLLQPDMAIVKTVTGSTVQSGIDVYKITFNNIGSGSATGVIVTDVLGTGMTYVSASIAPASVVNNSNGTTTITFNIGTVPAYAGGIITMTTQVKWTTPNCVTIQNGVSVATTNDLTLTNNISTATFQMQCPTNPNLWMQKDVVASTGGYVPNGYAVYTLSFGNSGSGTATGVVVTDTLPSDLTYVSSIPAAAVVSGQTLSWNIGTLAPGQQWLIKITVKINTTVPVCQNYIVDNIGMVTATNATGAQDNATFLVLCYDLYSNKVIDKPVVASGDIVTYTINYGNSGQIAAPNWSLVDSLPSGLQYVSGSLTILSGINIGQPVVTSTTASGQVLTWTGFTNMAPGYSGLVSLKAQILWPTTSGHVYVNGVCIVWDNNYNNNNCGTAVTTVTGTTTTGSFFDLNLNKSVDKSKANNGDTVKFTIVVMNESNVTASVNGYTVQDYLPAGIDYLGNPTGPSGMVTTLSGTKDITFSALPQLNPGDRITITFQATYRSNKTETNYAEICSYIGMSATSGIKDRDSNPCNRGRATGREDDESQASVGPNTGGGGGGWNPYCGDGVVRAGEQCDPGNALLGIKPAGVLSGQVCLPNCTLQTGGTTSITAWVKCSYIDPPAINVGEYMPYRWDMEYGYNTVGTGRTLATSFCTNSTGDIRVYTQSLQCEFQLKWPNGHVSTWDLPCYTNPHLSLIDTAFSAAKIKYHMDIFPGGASAIQITGANYLGLGEYMITMKVIGGRLCNGKALQPYDRICQMNFGVTKQYAVSRTPRGTFASTPDLPTYERQDGSEVLQISDAINALQAYILDTTNVNLISQMINKYVSLAVKADVITDKLPDNTTIQKAVVSKVPSKNIFVIDAKTPEGKKGMITVSDKATYQGGAFTLIVINGDLVVKGNMTQNSNGMFIVRDGDLTFSAEGDAQTNDQNQEVKWIFIGLHTIKAEGDGQPAFNSDLNKPWINGGRLVIDGILLGADLKDLVSGRRSIVEDWFNKRAGDGLLEDGSIVIKANPDIFTSLPPGAEDISLTLNIFKK